MAKQIDMALFNQGDEGEYARVYEMYKVELRFVVYKITKNVEETKDVLQETFAILHQKCKDFDSPAAINNFLYTVARNISLNYIKHKKVQLKWYKATRYQSQEIQEAEGLCTLLQTDFMNGLNQAIQKLPAIRRRVFELHYRDGKSNAEIAELLNSTPENVSSHLTNAYKNLRQLM